MVYVEWDGKSNEVRVECPPFEANLTRLRELKRIGVARFGEGPDGRKYWFVLRRHFRRFVQLFQGEFISDPKPHLILGEPAPPPPPYLAALDTNQPPNLALPLYPYQCVGASFLEWGVRNGLPVILADRRGLGKTAQAIGAKERLWAAGVLEEGVPTLDVTLGSLKIQTVRDGYGKFAPHRKVAAALGDKKKRMKVYERARELDVVVINYELLLQDWDILNEIGFQLVWCDEAHLKIANPDGKMHRALVELCIPRGFITTGSPVRKNPINLYGLIHAINPFYMESPEEFHAKYLIYEWNGRYPELVGYKHLDEFVAATEKLVLRRAPQDAGVYPPELRISNRYVEMSPLQEELEKLAREHSEQLREKRVDAQKGGADPNFIEMLQGREKLMVWVRHAIADDPLTLMLSKSDWVRRCFGERVAEWLREHNPSVRGLSCEDIARQLYSGKLKLPPNPKLDMLEEIIKEEVLPGKVLVFTGLKTVARTVYRRLAKYGVAHYVGGMSEVERDAQLQRFQKNPDIHILICTDAGGVGLNVQAAQFGINFNMPSDWSVVDQRAGRNNRLGSEFDENIWINLICQGSIDEQVIRGQKRGEKLSGFLVDANEKTHATLKQLSAAR